MADNYIDPLDAAKRRQYASRGASYFPGAMPPPIIDARGPTKFGGALSAPSLTPESAWQAQFQPGNIAAQTAAQPLRMANQFTNIAAQTAGQPFRTATQFPSIAQQTMGGQGLKTATPFTDIRALTASQPLRTASPTINLDELRKRYAH